MTKFNLLDKLDPQVGETWLIKIGDNITLSEMVLTDKMNLTVQLRGAMESEYRKGRWYCICDIKFIERLQ